MRGDGDKQGRAPGQSGDRTGEQGAKWGGQGAHPMFLVRDDGGLGQVLVAGAGGNRPRGAHGVEPDLLRHCRPAIWAQSGAEHLAPGAGPAQD